VFKGADLGWLTYVGSVPIPSGQGLNDISLVAAGPCVVAGNGYTHLISFSVGANGMLTQVTSLSTGASIAGMGAVKASDGNYYVAGAQLNYGRYAVAQVDPTTCALSNLSYIGSGETPASVAFMNIGGQTILYGGGESLNGLLLDYCPDFPNATCTGYSYTGYADSTTILVSPGCAFLGTEYGASISAIPLDANGQPSTNATTTPLGTDFYMSQMAWHNSVKAFFAPTVDSYDVNHVWTLEVGSGCALTVKGPASTGVSDGKDIPSLTAYPQVGP
jgi:hypothetical protein